jgi:hypothetical protein
VVCLPFCTLTSSSDNFCVVMLPSRSFLCLPLDNLSADASQNYFADGMTDELITDLAQISALRVISRTSVMVYKGARKPLPQIARDERGFSTACSCGVKLTRAFFAGHLEVQEKNGSSGRTRIHLKTSIEGLTEPGRRYKDMEAPGSSR